VAEDCYGLAVPVDTVALTKAAIDDEEATFVPQE
jgi:hypothetical protein